MRNKMRKRMNVEEELYLRESDSKSSQFRSKK